MSLITTHILDSSTGTPASGVRVDLLSPTSGHIADGVTDNDGRISELGPEALSPGTYQLVFDVGDYFASSDTTAFFPEITLTFTVGDDDHYHVPLLLSPFAYSTYRGS